MTAKARRKRREGNIDIINIIMAMKQLTPPMEIPLPPLRLINVIHITITNMTIIMTRRGKLLRNIWVVTETEIMIVVMMMMLMMVIDRMTEAVNITNEENDEEIVGVIVERQNPKKEIEEEERKLVGKGQIEVVVLVGAEVIAVDEGGVVVMAAATDMIHAIVIVTMIETEAETCTAAVMVAEENRGTAETEIEIKVIKTAAAAAEIKTETESIEMAMMMIAGRFDVTIGNIDKRLQQHC
jgi:hypothetical protein